MANVIIPGIHRADANPFAGMLNDDNQIVRAVHDFTRILRDSFVFDAQHHPQGYEFVKRINTAAERTHRVNIMARWFRELRGLGYGYVRAMDEIPKALRAELDGGSYTPPDPKRLWVTGGE